MTQEEHSSFIKTPQQLVIVVLLAFLVPVIGILLLVNFLLSGPTANPGALTTEAVAQRIQPVGRVDFRGGAPGATTAASAPAPAAAKAPLSGEEVYKSVCAACHQTGVAGAPKVGDKAAWAKLVQEPLDALVKGAINGVRAMPPRGGNPNLSDLEVARAVVLMANQSGGNYKEPAAAAAKQ